MSVRKSRIADAGEEPELVVEVLADLGVGVVEPRAPAVPVEVAGGRVVPAGDAGGGALGDVAAGAQARVEGDVPVRGADPVLVAGGVLRQADDAEGGAVAEVALQPQDAPGGLRLVDQAAVAVRPVLDLLRLEAEDAHVVLPLVAGQLDAAQDGDRRPAVGGEADLAAEEEEGLRGVLGVRPLADVEGARPFEEEGALLREEQGVAAQVDVLLVGLGLREVGLDGDVGHQVGGQVDLDVAAGVGDRRGRAVLRPLDAGDDVGGDVEAAPRLGAFQADDGAGLGELVARVPGVADRLPEAPLLLVGHLALDVEPPELLGLGGEAQGAPGDGDLDRPPLGIAVPLDAPDAVPVEVDLLALVADQAVDLHAAGVGGEDVAAAPVVVGVDEDLQGVVVAHVAVARQRGGDDLLGLRVVAAGADIEVVVVVAEVDVGLLGRRLALVRLDLGELAEPRPGLPDRLVELAVDHRRSGEEDRPGDVVGRIGDGGRGLRRRLLGGLRRHDRLRGRRRLGGLRMLGGPRGRHVGRRGGGLGRGGRRLRGRLLGNQGPGEGQRKDGHQQERAAAARRRGGCAYRSHHVKSPCRLVATP